MTERAARTALPSRYYERHSSPKWNVDPTPLMEYRLMRSWNLTPEEHRSLSSRFHRLATATRREYTETVNEALARFGERGPLISGIIRGHFPEYYKDLLRSLNALHVDYQDAATAHLDASRVATRWMNRDVPNWRATDEREGAAR